VVFFIRLANDVSDNCLHTLSEARKAVGVFDEARAAGEFEELSLVVR